MMMMEEKKHTVAARERERGRGQECAQTNETDARAGGGKEINFAKKQRFQSILDSLDFMQTKSRVGIKMM